MGQQGPQRPRVAVVHVCIGAALPCPEKPANKMPKSARATRDARAHTRPTPDNACPARLYRVKVRHVKMPGEERTAKGDDTIAAHLTDTQKRKIIRDYVEIGSYSAVAEKHGVSRNTVKNAVLANPKFAQKCREKKNKATLEIVAHMKSQRSKVCQIMDRYLDELLDVEQFEKLTPTQLSTALCAILDRFAPEANKFGNGEEEGDDPITAAVKESLANIKSGDM